jgi:hypothetical protein
VRPRTGRSCAPLDPVRVPGEDQRLIVENLSGKFSRDKQ